MQRFWCIDGGRSSHTEACPSLAVELKATARISGRPMVAAFSAIVSFLGKSAIL
jgi:hypothetical protein